MSTTAVPMPFSAVAPQDMFLVELLLDANQTENGWFDFLDHFRKHFNLHSCHIYIANMNSMALRFQEMAGPQPSEWQLKEYFEKYYETDYTHLEILRGHPHQWFTSNLMPNKEEIYSAPVIEQWARPNGIEYVSGATLFRDDIWSCVFVHNRGPQHGEYTQEEIERCRSLGPYIEKALSLRFSIQNSDKDSLRLKAICNQFRLPTAILNEFGELMTCNDSMDEFLQSNQVIQLNNKKHFLLPDAVQDKQFQMGITQLLAQEKGQELDYETKPLILTDQDKQYILGLQPTRTNHDKSNFIGAMVYIADLSLAKTISATSLQQLFNLTPAESQTCQLFCKGLPPKEIAKELGKSLHTVQEQLKTCYKKTNTKGQLQLMNLIASLPTQ